MLKKYSMFTMVLLITASLVGISTVYHPADVKTQPQQQLVPPGQVQEQPPIVQQQPPIQTQGNPQTTGTIMTQQRQQTIDQALEDRALLDRLFPQIIKRIDGRTLAQKIDAATLLQKIDAKTLAAKLLPFLDVKVIPSEPRAPITKVKISGISSRAVDSIATCAPNEVLVGGGWLLGGLDLDTVSIAKSARDYRNANSWAVGAGFRNSAEINAVAECIRVELALK